MSSKMIFLNTDLLNIPEEIKEELVERIKYVMFDKYQGTGVVITGDADTATSFAIADEQNQLQIVALHNIPIEGEISPNALDVAIHGSDVALVSLDDFDASDVNGLAEQVGAYVSHEAAHQFLPPGHSSDHTNLMNDDNEIGRLLDENKGQDLNFTELQKAIIRGDVEVDDHARLEDVEGVSANLSGEGVTEHETEHDLEDNSQTDDQAIHDPNTDNLDLDADPDVGIDLDLD